MTSFLTCLPTLSKLRVATQRTALGNLDVQRGCVRTCARASPIAPLRTIRAMLRIEELGEHRKTQPKSGVPDLRTQATRSAKR